MERIGGETMVLYADLRERLAAFEALRSVSSLPGDFVTKTIGAVTYYYFQATLPGGRTQIYIGPDSTEVRRLIEAHQAGERATEADKAMLQRLAAQIMAGGVPPVGTEMARVITRLADSGVFRVAGVVVGTIAFKVTGTHLGVIWEGGAQSTQDVDIATDTNVSVAVPDLKTDVPAALESLQMGFFPVPRLSRKEPSTPYAIRGKRSGWTC